MSQSQKASRAASLQKHTAIDSIPEDVAAIVVKMIQSWEKGRGSHTRTEEGRRSVLFVTSRLRSIYLLSFF